MKLPFFVSLMLLPMAAIAVDTTDCVQIGHAVADITIENVCHDEVARCALSEWAADDCATVRTECARGATEQNSAIEKNCVLMRCPMTETLLEYKNADKTMGFNDGQLVYADGASVVIDDLIADKENVYLYYRCPEQILLGAPSWYAFGPGADGFNMHRIAAD